MPVHIRNVPSDFVFAALSGAVVIEPWAIVVGSDRMVVVSVVIRPLVVGSGIVVVGSDATLVMGPGVHGRGLP